MKWDEKSNKGEAEKQEMRAKDRILARKKPHATFCVAFSKHF